MRYEELFSSNNYNGNGKQPFMILSGTKDLILSAPHSVNHYRNGAVKYADMYTGGIVLNLYKLTRCHAICSTLFTETDPNFDDDNEYKKELKRYIEDNNIDLLLDIHGAGLKRDYAVEVKTNDKISEKIGEYIREYFERELNDKCIYLKNQFPINTITKYISENTNCKCVQIEINRKYRNTEIIEVFEKLLIKLIEKIKINRKEDIAPFR